MADVKLGKRSLTKWPLTSFFHIKRSPHDQTSFEPPPSYISPHTDPRLPTLAMVQVLLEASASEFYQPAFDAILNARATESDYATIGQAIMSCQPDKQKYPPIFHVQIAKKTLNLYVANFTII